jgi:hypothetical protein
MSAACHARGAVLSCCDLCRQGSMRIISPGILNSRQIAQIISVVSSSSSPPAVVAAEPEGGLAGAGEPDGAAGADREEEEGGAVGSEGEEEEVGKVPRRCFLFGTGKVGSLSMSGCGMPVNCCAFTPQPTAKRERQQR